MAGHALRINERRFQPRLTLSYQKHLLEIIRALEAESMTEQFSRLDSEVSEADARHRELLAMGVAAPELVPTLAYRTSLRVLRDLLLQGWTAGTDDDGILLTPPLASAFQLGPDELKSALRESFSFARRSQLSDPATAAFVRDMERRGVEAILADGAELAERLSGEPEAGRAETGVRPSLELVTPDARDETTGLRLQDLWRYARHFWSIPYQSTPGRNVFYLIRDNAGPGRPLMGIAALGNPLIRLSRRDERLGWTRGALQRRLEGSDPAVRLELGRRFSQVIRDAIDEVFQSDFALQGLRLPDALRVLEETERGATQQRNNDLSRAGEARTEDYRLIREAHTAVESGFGDTVDWVGLALTPLYRRKRAAALKDRLRAAAAFEEWHVATDPGGLLAGLARSGDGPLGEFEHAVETALRRIKQLALTERVMEIITCGAVPPYGEILGGKLVAMLMTSPAVVRDVHDRYQGRMSLIASAMKGAPVVRNPQLAYLTTSSLYSAGSTQYDGIRIPTGPDANSGSIAFRRLGITESFGTVHFAQDTRAALTEMAWRADHRNRRVVNHLFGEGVSPKLRALRSGLDALGLQSDTFLRHHSPRVLYGAALCRNSDNVLLGSSEAPDYFARDAGAHGTEAILDHWRNKLLLPRLKRKETFDRLRLARRSSLLLGNDLPPIGAGATSRDQNNENQPLDQIGDAPAPSLSFVEKLYRSTSSYADRLTPEELDWIHIDLALEPAIVSAAERNSQIIITGNPGDGKTHLIERLRGDLEGLGALVITDANELRDEDILAAWQSCADLESPRPLVLAINEWPLFTLRRHAPSFAALSEAIRQVRQSVYYLSKPDEAHENVLVVDLSLRNVLSEATVAAAIDRLTDERFYRGLHAEDPALTNREALRQPRVRERLFRLLDRAAREGGHFSMRQLMGLIAYLIAGGATTAQRLASQDSGQFHYSTLAFEGGVGPLLRRISLALDPTRVTHPQHDADLWRGVTVPGAWLDPSTAALGPQQLQEAARLTAFKDLKRRFFFEHVDGGILFDLIPSDERQFDALASQGQAGDHNLVRDLILAINRFFEPDCDSREREELSLWQSHRFDVRPPDTFVAMRKVSHSQLRIEPPKLAGWAEQWLDPHQWLPRTFALVASLPEQGTVAQLLVDRQLFLTLNDARRGLGRANWSMSAARRITRFIDHLHGVAEAGSTAEDVRVRNATTDLDRKFEIQRSPARYLL